MATALAYVCYKIRLRLVRFALSHARYARFTPTRAPSATSGLLVLRGGV